MKNLIKRSIEFQKNILSINPGNFFNGMNWLYCFIFCFISLPVALVVCITLFIFDIYHELDSVFLMVTKKFKVFNLYISGYVIFFIVMLTFFVIFVCVGLPVRFVLNGNLDGLLDEMLVFRMKDFIEICFCIIFYHFFIFYMLCTKREKGFTNINKKKEVLILAFIIGLLFFFVRVWIMENIALQYTMYVLVGVSLFVLPAISCDFQKNESLHSS